MATKWPNWMPGFGKKAQEAPANAPADQIQTESAQDVLRMLKEPPFNLNDAQAEAAVRKYGDRLAASPKAAFMVLLDGWSAVLPWQFISSMEKLLGLTFGE